MCLEDPGADVVDINAARFLSFRMGSGGSGARRLSSSVTRGTHKRTRRETRREQHSPSFSFLSQKAFDVHTSY